MDFNAFVTVCALLAVVVARGGSVSAQLADLSVALFQASGSARLEQARGMWRGWTAVARFAGCHRAVRG